jgi:hypothetical protein
VPWCRQCGRSVQGDEPEPGLRLPAEGPPEVPSTDAEAPDGTARDRCPSCGTELEVEEGAGEEEGHPKAPWHFKVLVVGTVVYLGYRLYQGIGWLIHHA